MPQHRRRPRAIDWEPLILRAIDREPANRGAEADDDIVVAVTNVMPFLWYIRQRFGFCNGFIKEQT